MIGRPMTAVEFANEDASPWGELKLIAGTANPELAQLISNEIGVRPNGDQSTARKVDSDLDSAVDKNLDAMLVQHRLKDNVRYDVKNGVVTLKGNVASEAQRTSVEKLAKNVPNVKEVVNELDIQTTTVYTRLTQTDLQKLVSTFDAMGK